MKITPEALAKIKATLLVSTGLAGELDGDDVLALVDAYCALRKQVPRWVPVSEHVPVPGQMERVIRPLRTDPDYSWSGCNAEFKDGKWLHYSGGHEIEPAYILFMPAEPACPNP